jgi:hypothetical protein
MDQLTDSIGRFGQRLRLRDGWRLAQRSLWLAGAVAVSVQLAGRIWPVERLWLWSIGPLALWLLGVLGVSFLRPMSPLQVARRCDAELGLKERLATALTLERWKGMGNEGRSKLGALPAFQPSLVALQRQDTLAVATAIDPRRSFPLDWLRRPLLLAAVLAAAAVTLAVLPNRMDGVLAERAAVKETAKEQAAQIETLRQEVEEMTELTPAEREDLLRRLAELAEQLQANRGDPEEALADLSRVEEALQQKVDPRATGRAAALGTLAAQLQALAGEQAGEKADLAEIEKALEALAEQAGEMDQASRQALAQSLAQMAGRAAQAGDAELAQALSELAQAAQAGDAQAAAQAAQETAQAMARAQSDLAVQAVVQQSLAQVQGSRLAIAQAGQAPTTGSAQAPGQSPGQGQTQGQGQPGGGGGTQASTLPPARRTGKAGQPVGEGQPGGTGTLDTQVYAPWEHRNGSGEELTLPGQDTGQGETETHEQRDPLPGAQNEALVPYHQVYYDYLDAANEAVEQSYIPSGLKDYVRAYFSQLEP